MPLGWKWIFVIRLTESIDGINNKKLSVANANWSALLCLGDYFICWFKKTRKKPQRISNKNSGYLFSMKFSAGHNNAWRNKNLWLGVAKIKFILHFYESATFFFLGNAPSWIHAWLNVNHINISVIFVCTWLERWKEFKSHTHNELWIKIRFFFLLPNFKRRESTAFILYFFFWQ